MGYEDYRSFLRDHYEARKAERRQFSYRFMAGRLDIDPGQLAWILKGRLHLPVRALGATIRLCRLEGREAAYFEELVRIAHARSAGERNRSRERLAALRGVEAQALHSPQEAYYERFHHAVVRALAPLAPTALPEALGRLCLPPLLPEEARASTDLLERLGLLLQQEGEWKVPVPHITAGSDVSRERLRGYHAQAIHAAQTALREIPPAQRDISMLTAALEASDFEALRTWIADLRREAQAIAQATARPDRVVQLNVQLFPVASRPRSGAGA